MEGVILVILAQLDIDEGVRVVLVLLDTEEVVRVVIAPEGVIIVLAKLLGIEEVVRECFCCCFSVTGHGGGG